MHVIKSIIARSKIIIGGGPVGSAAAVELSKRCRDVMLAHDPKDLGSHNDESRLVRLAVEEDVASYHRSRAAIDMLLDRNQFSETSFMLSKPGVLFVASEGTPLAQKLKASSYQDLHQLSEAELQALYPEFKFSFPDNTLFWVHEDGYVVNPAELSNTNRLLAQQRGCEIVSANAEVMMRDAKLLVGVEGGLYSAPDIFMLTGSRNKEILQSSLPELSGDLSTVSLTAISTRRYSSGGTSYPLMPIMVGEIKHDTYPHIFDFSTMPESTSLVKTRLSGFGDSEVIPCADHHIAMDNDGMKMLYDEFFPSISPAFHTPIDFNRCVTYRNSAQHNPVDYFNVNLTTQSRHATTQRIFTTLGCFGVHVRYGLLMGKKLARTNPGAMRNIIVSSKESSSLSGQGIKVGGTSLKKIRPQFFLKMEGENPTGSLIDRSIFHFFSKLVKKDVLSERPTLITYGSVELFESIQKIKALLAKDYDLDFNVIVVVPKAWERPYGDQQTPPGLNLGGRPTIPEVARKLRNVGDACLFYPGSIVCSQNFSKYLSREKGLVHFDLVDADSLQFLAKSLRDELKTQLPEVTDVVLPESDSALALRNNFSFSSSTPRIHFFAKSFLPLTTSYYQSVCDGLRQSPDDMVELEGAASKILSKNPKAIIAGVASGKR
ncbi:MAG: hypothetical protein CMF39_05770 [Legionellaceae bacterium]|nr:hypothetical protein [Legionellaceae bacterium]|tara:strand:- start:184 stop:2160 length:1977 start_codon:yes stop_codon:yes gene_type:complete